MPIDASLIVNSLGWALLHSLWQIALVAAVIFAALRVIPRHNAQLRFVTAYGGLAASLLLFIVTWAICYRTIGSVEPSSGAYAPPAEGWQAVIAALGRTTWLISLIWGLGFSWLGVRYAQALRATARLKHEGTGPVPADWEMRFRLWIERLGADPRATILQSSRITTPLTIGTLKPIILVPTGFFLRLPIDQAEAILIHEIAHICRQDYLLGLVQAMICNIFFFHPAIAYLSRQIDIEREYACDARVVEETGNTIALAQGLGKVALESRDLLPGFAMAADGGATPLMDRITRLRERPFRRESGTMMPFAALTLVLIGCLTIAASADASFSSGTAKESGGTDADMGIDEVAAIDAAPTDDSVTSPGAPAGPVAITPNTRATQLSAQKTPDNRSRTGRRATTGQQGWAFTPEPGWTFSFRGSDNGAQKSDNAAFEPVIFQSEGGGFLRNAALQTGVFSPGPVIAPRISENDEECDEKIEHIAHQRQRAMERQAARNERHAEREQARYEAEIERAQAQIERQMEREGERIEREMERVGRAMERVAESHQAGMEREMSALAAQMAVLSTDLETRIEGHIGRARVLADRARSRTGRPVRHRSPPIAPAPPEPTQPVVTISFNFESIRAAALASSAQATAQAAAATTG